MGLETGKDSRQREEQELEHRKDAPARPGQDQGRRLVWPHGGRIERGLEPDDSSFRKRPLEALPKRHQTMEEILEWGDQEQDRDCLVREAVMEWRDWDNQRKKHNMVTHCAGSKGKDTDGANTWRGEVPRSGIRRGQHWTEGSWLQEAGTRWSGEALELPGESVTGRWPRPDPWRPQHYRAEGGGEGKGVVRSKTRIGKESFIHGTIIAKERGQLSQAPRRREA